MNKKRPVNLDLSTIKLPIMAIASILHRVSGLVLFLFMPVVLFIFGLSMQSESAFAHANELLREPLYQVVFWAFCSALSYHLLAGVRHMVMDLGFGETLGAGRCSAGLVIVLAVIMTIILGFWIW